MSNQIQTTAFCAKFWTGCVKIDSKTVNVILHAFSSAYDIIQSMGKNRPSAVRGHKNTDAQKRERGQKLSEVTE